MEEGIQSSETIIPWHCPIGKTLLEDAIWQQEEALEWKSEAEARSDLNSKV